MKPLTSLVAACTATALLSLSCGGPTAPTPPPPVIQPNETPKITSLSVAAPRVEVGEGIGLTAVVTDAETPVAQLVYSWSANVAGTFSGAGSEVTWRPSTDAVTPVAATITLTVIERYTVPRTGGGTETRENKVEQRVVVNVNNSRKETEGLAMAFLTDFANSKVPPEVCVRNFTDTCKGKAAEYADIVDNRATLEILSSSFRVDRVEFYDGRTRAGIWAPCEFTDRYLVGGALHTSSGVCIMSAKYESFRWWLCNSNWCSAAGENCTPRFLSRPGRIMFEGCS